MHTSPRITAHFRCECGFAFEAEPTRTEDAADRPWHPHRYFADCPQCASAAAQAAWEVNLFKAHAKATGPRTAAGLAAVTQNIAGHPTPEETQITRFNALKHGLRSQVAQFYPAAPGRYPQCDRCDVREGCAARPACLKKTELFMKHHIAFESGDPGMLSGLRANLHANLCAIVDDAILSIIQDGVSQKTPQWYYDKDGGFHLAEFADKATGEMTKIMEITANPLIKLVGDLVSKLGLTLADSSMTTRQTGDAAAPEAADHGITGDEMRQWKIKSDKQMEQLQAMISRSQNVIDVTPQATDG